MKELVLIQQAIRDQILKSKHMLTFEQLFQLALDLKQYFFLFFLQNKN